MQTHSETSRKRQGPRVSPIGLVTALAVFVIALFAFGGIGLQDEAPPPAVNPAPGKAGVPASAGSALNDGRRAEERAVSLLKKSVSQKNENFETRTPDTIERPAKPKVEKAHRADAARTAKQERRAAKPAAAPVERYGVIPLNPRRMSPPQPGGSKVPSAVKLPISGQKIPDTVVKVDAPPPASGKETAPQWYTVKLKPVPSKTLADATASGLRQRGFVESQTASGPNGTYYVKIGGYGFRNAAEDAKKQLGALGFTDAHIEEKTVAK